MNNLTGRGFARIGGESSCDRDIREGTRITGILPMSMYQRCVNSSCTAQRSALIRVVPQISRDPRHVNRTSGVIRVP